MAPAPLSARAQRYLAELRRYEPAPIARVEEELAKESREAIGSWLAFHENFAGYELNIGRDGMVLGLVHDTRRYSNPWHGVELGDDRQAIRCADMDPHYTVELDRDGHFNLEHVHYSNFEMFVERSAQYLEFASKGQVTDYIDTANETALDAIGSTERNEALSDTFSELWEGEAVMGTKQPGEDSWQSILTIEPGMPGKSKSIYKPHTPPTGPPSLNARLSSLFRRRG